MKIKFPSYAIRGFKFHLKFRVTSLKESFESLRKVSANSCDLPEFQACSMIGLLI